MVRRKGDWKYRDRAAIGGLFSFAMHNLKLEDPLIREFAASFSPLEGIEGLLKLTDKCTGAVFCECHILASTLAKLATTDVPLDPDEQPEYRANRDIRLNHKAFTQMKADAEKGRAFSNIVAEYVTQFNPSFPLKIVGGQHRFQAIQHALAKGVDEYHGIKVYFSLDKDQRMDVQLISNTQIAVSTALIDRMKETARGSELRAWSQEVGILSSGKDFSDQHVRGAVSVRMVRSFIVNYFKGKSVQDFDKTATTPILCLSGDEDEDWNLLVDSTPDIWQDSKLKKAGKEFSLLVTAQRTAFVGKKVKPDFPNKALNIAVMAAWAYVAGVLSNNSTRLQRHYDLKSARNHDPLNAENLAKGRFKSDSVGYRGLGNRTDAKERGRLVELFHMQAEDGSGISYNLIQNAIRKYEMKVIALEMVE